jgi:hypothetical protein
MKFFFLYLIIILADCVSSVASIKVTIGEIDVTPGTASNTWASTRYVVQAKMWTSYSGKNIAVVYLPSDVYYSKNSQIMNLYLKDPEISGNAATYYIGKSVKIACWGRMGNSTAAALSNTLKYISIPIVDSNTCTRGYSEHFI